MNAIASIYSCSANCLALLLVVYLKVFGYDAACCAQVYIELHCIKHKTMMHTLTQTVFLYIDTATEEAAQREAESEKQKEKQKQKQREQ